jgi:hypothetical protein
VDVDLPLMLKIGSWDVLVLILAPNISDVPCVQHAPEVLDWNCACENALVGGFPDLMPVTIDLFSLLL